MSAAVEEFGLDPLTATVADVKRVYRDLARLYHPDRGGDATAFQNLNTTYRRALVEVARRKCRTCGGSGAVPMKVRRPSFVTPQETCPDCKGSGKS